MDSLKFETKLVESLANYFNNILRNSLKYEEVFRLILNKDDRTILVESNIDSTLIQMMSSNSVVKDKIVDTLFQGLKNAPFQTIVQLFIMSEKEFIIQY